MIYWCSPNYTLQDKSSIFRILTVHIPSSDLLSTLLGSQALFIIHGLGQKGLSGRKLYGLDVNYSLADFSNATNSRFTTLALPLSNISQTVERSKEGDSLVFVAFSCSFLFLFLTSFFPYANYFITK